MSDLHVGLLGERWVNEQSQTATVYKITLDSIHLFYKSLI